MKAYELSLVARFMCLFVLRMDEWVVLVVAAHGVHIYYFSPHMASRVKAYDV